MISETLKAVLEFIKLTPRYIAIIAIIAAFLLFASDSILTRIGVLKTVQDHRPWIGLAFIGATAIFLVNCGIGVLRWMKRWKRRRALDKHIIARLHSLTEAEKQILRYYIENRTRTNKLRYDDGVVQGLAAAGIIYQASKLGYLVTGFAYNISEIAWDQLNLYPELLEGETNTCRTDKMHGWP